MVQTLPAQAVVFTARCPACGGDATWTQAPTGSLPEHFTIACPRCDHAAR